MHDSRRRFLAAVATGATGALAGCGGTERETETPEATETATEAATETATQTETPTETPTRTATPTATDDPDRTVIVGVDESLRFDPEAFEIAVGDTVRWEWANGGHNVRPDTIPAESDWSGTAGGDGDTYGSGHVYTFTFETAGEYSYYCAPHQSLGMVGSVTVTN